MRIGPNLANVQGLSSDRAENSSANGRAVSEAIGGSENFPEDTVSITSLTSKAMQTPVVREDQVESLRQSVMNGTYELNPRAIAAAMVGEERS